MVFNCRITNKHMYCLWCGWVKFFLPVCFCVSNELKPQDVHKSTKFSDKKGTLRQGHPPTAQDKPGCMFVDLSQLVFWLSQWCVWSHTSVTNCLTFYSVYKLWCFHSVWSLKQQACIEWNIISSHISNASPNLKHGNIKHLYALRRCMNIDDSVKHVWAEV